MAKKVSFYCFFFYITIKHYYMFTLCNYYNVNILHLVTSNDIFIQCFVKIICFPLQDKKILLIRECQNPYIL